MLEELESGEIVEEMPSTDLQKIEQTNSADCKTTGSVQSTDLALDLFAPCSSNSVLESSQRSKKFTMWTDCILADRQKQTEFQKQKKFNQSKKSKLVANEAMKYCTDMDLVVKKVNSKILKSKETKNSKQRYENKVEEMVSMLSSNLFEIRLDILRKAVKIVGFDVCIELSKEALEIDKNGGMLTNEGNRRTKGGIFFQLIKQKANLSEYQKKLIFYRPGSQMSVGKKMKRNEKKKFKKMTKNIARQMDRISLSKDKPAGKQSLAPQPSTSSSSKISDFKEVSIM